MKRARRGHEYFSFVICCVGNEYLDCNNFDVRLSGGVVSVKKDLEKEGGRLGGFYLCFRGRSHLPISTLVVRKDPFHVFNAARGALSDITSININSIRSLKV